MNTKWLVSAALIALLLTVVSPVAAAAAECSIDPFPAITHASQGPYAMAMGVMPSKPTLGSTRLLVRVCDPQTGGPVEGLEVAVYPVSPGGTQGSAIYLLSRYGGTADYGTEIRVKTPGIWTYRIEVTGKQGAAIFDAPVFFEDLPPREGNVSLVAFLIASAAIIGTGVYLSLRTRAADA